MSLRCYPCQIPHLTKARSRRPTASTALPLPGAAHARRSAADHVTGRSRKATCTISQHLVICAGAAGALVNGLSIGDVVVATETVEHDIRNKFGLPLLPRFGSAKAI